MIFEDELFFESAYESSIENLAAFWISELTNNQLLDGIYRFSNRFEKFSPTKHFICMILLNELAYRDLLK